MVYFHTDYHFFEECIVDWGRMVITFTNNKNIFINNQKTFLHLKLIQWFFTFSSHTEYVKRESIIIARVKKKKFSPFDECSCFVCLRRQNKHKKLTWYNMNNMFCLITTSSFLVIIIISLAHNTVMNS